MRLDSIVLVPGLVLALGCGSAAPPATGTSTKATPAAPSSFQNPGGMWMPRQLADQADTLRALGLQIDPQALTDPLAPPLAAVVSLGGCSASFVSPDGLIITNHHCVQGALQYHSTPEDNLVENGFLARTRAEEKWNGPAARVYVTQAITDVTERMLGGLDAIASDRARYDEIDAREKKLIAECEADRPHLRCSVAAYFRGAEYYLIEKLEIRDVRLVYAPHNGIGWFGGDEDNWMWPRHTGDFSFYRAYVGKDGMPADHSENNVPYRPKHYLEVATEPLRKGDLIMVAGYPGRTHRHETAAEVSEAVEWSLPRRIESLSEYVTALEKVSEQSEATAIKARTWMFGLQNGIKAERGTLEGMTRGGLLARKKELEKQLTAWIDGDEGRRQAYGDVLDKMAALDAERRATRERDSDLSALRFSGLLGAASTIVRMAEERPKPDAEREPGFQERDWKRIEGWQRSMKRSHDRNIDRAMFTLALRRAARHPEHNRDWLALVVGEGPIDDTSIERAVERLYQGTKLESEELRLELLSKATTESLKAHSDPFIQLAVALRPLQKDMEERAKRHDGAMAVLKPRYIAALREFHRTVGRTAGSQNGHGQLAPDANGTLRVTYGTVRGYKPRPDAAEYEPFTVLSQVPPKHRDQYPFDVPDALLQAVRDQRFGPYVDEILGEVPVNFLSDADTTGGNSGSPTLNRRGELIGLLFDGNYESMASDWLFIPELTRAIHVDIRYVLWIMDEVDGAHHLMREMGVNPSAPAR